MIRVKRDRSTPIPWELQDEVELFARQHGRTGKLHCIPPGVWFARFSLKPDDKMLLAYQRGHTGEVPTEDIHFHIRADQYDPKVHPVRPELQPKRGDGDLRMVPLDVIQMGASGLREYMERANTWSGRGKFNSPHEAFKAAEESNRIGQQRLKDKTVKETAYNISQKRKQYLGIPTVQGADFSREE